MRVVLLALLAPFLASCEWTPLARPASPELILEGTFRLVSTQRVDRRDLALVVASGEGGPELALVDVQGRSRCGLPEAGTIYAIGLAEPMSEDPSSVAAARLVLFDDAASSLYFADERCQRVGPTLATRQAPVTVRGADGRSARPRYMVLDEGGVLWLLDPWADTKARLAEGVAAAREAVAQTNEQPLHVWTLESGQLVLRDERGQALTRLGRAVSEFTQTLASGTRVAYVDQGALFEAVSPDFVPRFFQQDVCGVAYSGFRLSFFSPCGGGRLHRYDLSTGELEVFEPGVGVVWESGGWRFERGGGETPRMWVTPPEGARTELTPPLDGVTPLDETALAGRDATLNLGVWSATGGFQVVLPAVRGFAPLIDSRRPGLQWLVHHGAGDDGVGTLSLLDGLGGPLTTVAERVPADRYRLFGLFSGELVVAMLRDPTDEGATLEVRLIPELLGDELDQGVESFAVLPNLTAPALLYVVSEPGREGLWRVAL